MNPELKDVSHHIFELGVGILSQAQRNNFYTDYGYEVRLSEDVFAVMQAAQAAELIIKAAIAENHPLLIFSNLPKSHTVKGEYLSLDDLFENAKTIQYSELPERLWSTTGYKIEELGIYNSFGKLRNCIQHFGVPQEALSTKTANFIYKVIDPILEHFWGEYAVDYVDLYDHENDIFELLAARNIKIRYPDHFKKQAESAYKNSNTYEPFPVK